MIFLSDVGTNSISLTNFSGGPQIRLTAEEQKVFGQLYRQADPDYTQIVTGEVARTLFIRSGLSPAILGEIWQLADPNNKGYLDQQGFSVALRIIGHVQNGQRLTPNLANVRKYLRAPLTPSFVVTRLTVSSWTNCYLQCSSTTTQNSATAVCGCTCCSRSCSVPNSSIITSRPGQLFAIVYSHCTYWTPRR